MQTIAWATRCYLGIRGNKKKGNLVLCKKADVQSASCRNPRQPGSRICEQMTLLKAGCNLFGLRTSFELQSMEHWKVV